MTETARIDKRKNKKFVIDNRLYLKKYALSNSRHFGRGVVVINLLLLDTAILTEEDIINNQKQETEITLHKPLSYIPENNFWFKMLYLKIKKQYKIDLKEQCSNDNQFTIVFIKDPSVEHFSIYSLKLETN